MDMKKDKNSNLGSLLRELRKRNGLSIKGLSSQLDVDYSYISKIENNKSFPSEAFIEKASMFFNYDKDELMLIAGKIPVDILQILRENPKDASDYLRKTFAKEK